MNKRNIIIGAVILGILLIALKFIFSGDYSIYKFSISKEVRLQYINVVDEVSKGKVQVNWREAAAVDAAFNYGMVETSTNSSIKRIAERFIIEDKKGYTLRSIDDVVKSFHGKKEDVSNAKKYLKVINKSREIEKGYKKNFFESLKDDVMKMSMETGMLPSVIIGQAALESNWGRSLLSSKYNNLFGIKADPSWKGEKVNLSTSEYYNTKIKDDFRVYKNLSDSVKDFGDFMKKNPRYKKAGVFDSKTYKEQINCVEKAGYSTITNEKGEKVYAKYVLDIITSNDLQLWDWEIKNKQVEE